MPIVRFYSTCHDFLLYFVVALMLILLCMCHDGDNVSLPYIDLTTFHYKVKMFIVAIL